MTVGGPYAGPVDVGRLDVPGGSGGIVAGTLVAGGGAGTLMKGRQAVDDVLALDIQGRARGYGSDGGGGSLGAFAGAALGGGGHGGVEGGELVHHALVLVLLVGMDSLCVLTKVVKTRELFPAMASERTFPCMFP